jgi:hypothetical protein
VVVYFVAVDLSALLEEVWGGWSAGIAAFVAGFKR